MLSRITRNRSTVAFPRLSTSSGSSRAAAIALRHVNLLEYSTTSPDKPATSASSDSENPSNALQSLVFRYRQSTTPVPAHLHEKIGSARRLKQKQAFMHEAKQLLAAQRKARIGLKLYETLSEQELSGLLEDLNNFDIRTEIQRQEYDTVPAVKGMASKDSRWELESHDRISDGGTGAVHAAVGKRLSKIYRFDDWTLGTKHFWKRFNEYFEQQDHHGEVNVRFDPDTKLTEIRIHIDTHTPKALPKMNPDHAEEGQQFAAAELPSPPEASSEPVIGPGNKRKIIIGPPALTRKDFILAWSCDVAAFRSRQKQASLENRAARREARLQEAESGANSDQNTNSFGEGKAHIAETSVALEPEKEEQLRSGAISSFTDGLPTAGNGVHENGLQRQISAAADSANQESASTVTSEAPHATTAQGAATRRKARSSFGSDGLSLQHFLSRTQILAEYRKSVRATKTLPDSRTRRETLDWLRQDLERLKGETDLRVIKEVLARFRRDSKQIFPSIGLSTLSDGEHAGSRLTGRK